MKAVVRDLGLKENGSLTLPSQFSEPVRSDLIKRAFDTIMANKRQPYGADPRAGKNVSAKLSRRRNDYRGGYGKGISRSPRKIMRRMGMQMSWVGALAPFTVGGRRAHPPKAEKIWSKKINDKERCKAIRSALSATLNSSFVGVRHVVPETYPLIVVDDLESISKTKDVVSVLSALGVSDDLERSSKKKIRGGNAARRGRVYRKRTGPLLVVSKSCPLIKSARSIAGVDVVAVNNLNVELLAPGAVPGRLAVYSQSAVEVLKKENLFSK